MISELNCKLAFKHIIDEVSNKPSFLTIIILQIVLYL
jgi:hypothetical protein